MNGCECNRPISSTTEFLNSCQDEKNALIFLRNMLKGYDIQRNNGAIFNAVISLHLILMTEGNLRIEHISYMFFYFYKNKRPVCGLD
jgi:hypothetical protein